MSEGCMKCNSKRLVRIEGKTSDEFSAHMKINTEKTKHFDGYVPTDMGIGGGDEIEFVYCLDCGQIQGDFPLETTSLEKDK